MGISDMGRHVARGQEAGIKGAMWWEQVTRRAGTGGKVPGRGAGTGGRMGWEDRQKGKGQGSGPLSPAAGFPATVVRGQTECDLPLI